MAKRSRDRKPASSQSTRQSRTRARRDARLAEERNRRRVMLAAGIAIAAAVAFLMIFFITRPQEAPLPEDLFDRYTDIPQTFDTDGFPMLGDPDAPVRVVEYSSFSCPSCLTWHEDNTTQLIEHVRAGEINFTYVPLQTGSVPNAEGAAKVALCAAQQGAFFEMHDALFAWQGAYGNRAFTQQRLNSGIDNFNLNDNAFSNCRGGSAVSAQLDTAEAVATDRGVNTTPSFSVQGNLLSNDDDLFDVIQQTLQNIIATTGVEPVPLELQNGSEATPQVEVTAEVTAEPTVTDEPTVTATEAVEVTETATP